MYGVREYINFILLDVAVQFFQHHLMKRLSFLHVYSCLFCCRLVDHSCIDLFLTFLSCFIDLYFFFFSQYHSFLMITTLRYSLKSRSLVPPALFSFSRFHWLFAVFCVSIQIFENFFSSSVKNALGNLIGILLNPYIALGSIVILTVLIIFQIQEHVIYFHLFVSSLFSSVSLSFQNTGLLSL